MALLQAPSGSIQAAGLRRRREEHGSSLCGHPEHPTKGSVLAGWWVAKWRGFWEKAGPGGWDSRGEGCPRSGKSTEEWGPAQPIRCWNMGRQPLCPEGGGPWS